MGDRTESVHATARSSHAVHIPVVCRHVTSSRDGPPSRTQAARERRFIRRATAGHDRGCRFCSVRTCAGVYVFRSSIAVQREANVGRGGSKRDRNCFSKAESPVSAVTAKLQQLFLQYVNLRLETYRKLPDMKAAGA